MDIAFTSDNNYLTYLGVTLCSICENNRGTQLNFHIIMSDKITSGKEKILYDISNRYNASLNLYSISEDLFMSFPLTKSENINHISLATYFRLYLSEILPNSIDKVLYLDCDIICNGSIMGLWNTDIRNVAVGVVPDMDEANLNIYRRLRYPVMLGYFNAGVLLVNLEYWRSNKVREECLAYIDANADTLLYNDQDVLNYVFRNMKTLLPIKYNVQESALYERVNISWEYDEQLEEALRNPVIIHYTTGQKPWNTGCKHPWKSEWYKYLEKSGIDDFKPIKTKRPKKTAFQVLRELMVKVGIVESLFRYRKDLKI